MEIEQLLKTQRGTLTTEMPVVSLEMLCWCISNKQHAQEYQHNLSFLICAG